MTDSLRIVVTGLAATYPFGGVFWDYVQYLLGFHRLGHDVLYLEDTGRWGYDPKRETFVEDGSGNARHLEAQLRRLDPGLAERWFYRDAAGRCYGRPWARTRRFCRSADIFLHISACCRMREEYLSAERTVFLDSDPMYTQSSFPDVDAGTADPEAAARVAMLREHDVFFTFGLNVGAADCRVPAGGLTWHPTRQPVLLDCFPPLQQAKRRRVLTTVGSWEPREDGPVVDGRRYLGKSVEFLRMIDLPKHSPVPLELALSGPAPVEKLTGRGWRVRPALEISKDPWIYRDYLARSFAECSVAKNAYVAGNTGWVSTRTACYLALGVPAVVQETGFSRYLPTGEGLFAFNDPGEAAAAIEAIAAGPERHAKAARRLAAEHFDAASVLTGMLETIAASPVPASGPRPARKSGKTALSHGRRRRP